MNPSPWNCEATALTTAHCFTLNYNFFPLFCFTIVFLIDFVENKKQIDGANKKVMFLNETGEQHCDRNT